MTMKLDEFKKTLDKSYITGGKLNVNLNVELYEDDDGYGVFISDGSSSGYSQRVISTEDVIDTIKHYLEEQV